MQQIVWASALGTAVEWYDFVLYGTAAALVFNKLFFPTFDPVVGTIAALGSYAVGFVARPVGGAIFGHFGDRVGRKAMLMLTMIIMGSGTFLIGCLPTYEQIGIAAPILLTCFRLLQGIGIGGEWGGAVLMVIENSDRDRRGLFGSLVQMGFLAGLVLATLAFSAVSQLPEAQFLSWGWRAGGVEPPRASVLTFSIPLYQRLLATGRFLTSLPTSMLRHDPTLRRLPVAFPAKPRPVGIMTLKNRMLSPLAEMFIDCARKIARPLAKSL
jgi:MHS family shikimate/dehydroshikimate transporter-like MFS transporter